MDRFKKPPPDAWRDAMRRNKPSLCITGEDAEILIQFADDLGCGDVESERGNIRAACAELELAERSAKAERDRDEPTFKRCRNARRNVDCRTAFMIYN